MPTVEYLNYDVVDDQGWDMYDADVFERAADAGLDDGDYGTLDVNEGEIDMDMQQILSDEEVEDKNVRLTCIGSAATDEVRIVYNAKHLDYLQNRVI